MNTDTVSMNPPGQCPQCGGSLPAGRLQGLCPRCVGRQAEALLAGSPQHAVPDQPTDLGSPAPPLAVEQPGEHIGRYRLLEKIGEGGMGVVWMAEQEEPVRRKVALKIIKLGMDTREVVARFEAERQALAMMDHPNIAKVFDGGATGYPLPSDGRGAGGEGPPAGRPYFVMELVRGLPITKYCDAVKMPIRQRLELFAQVCRAVQHAHQKGVIHRDLKPSNILVTEQDGRAVPKVIDFGIAKATAGRLTDKTLFTGFAQLIGTPAYMSPEQAGLGSLDIDTRSDTYSLGVVLYQLLTGHTPFDTRELLKEGYEAVLRTIREVDPPRPSTRLRQDRLLQSGTGAQSAIRNAQSAIDPDLDWIVMKCLEKDRSRRYDTPNGLALDLERYLHDEPVLARPPSTGYRLRKFVRKHRGPVAAAAGFLLLLIAATAVSSALALWANRERGRAEHQRTAAQVAQARANSAESEARENERQAKSAETVAKANEAKATKSEADARTVLFFFTDRVLAAARPEGKQGGLGHRATIRDAVEAAEPTIAESFADQPLVESAIRETLGHTYVYLGDYEKAIRQHERAWEVGKSSPDASEKYKIGLLGNLGAAYRDAHRTADALRVLEEVVQQATATLGPDHHSTLTYLDNLALANRDAGRLNKSIEMFEKLVAATRTAYGSNHHRLSTPLGNLAGAYRAAGRLKDALPLYEEALEIAKASDGPEHPETLVAMNNLALAYSNTGRLPEAIALNEETLRLRKLKLSLGHPHTLVSMNNLARAYFAARRTNDAVVLFEELVQLQKAKLNLDDADLLRTVDTLADAYQRVRRFADAESLCRETLETLRPKVPSDHIGLADLLAALARGRFRQGHFADAEPPLRECLPIYEKHQPRQPSHLKALDLLGRSLLGQKKFADAEPILLRAYDGWKQLGTERPSISLAGTTKETAERLVQLYEALGQTGKATEWREKLDGTPEQSEKP